MTTNSIAILQELSIHPGFVFFCQLLKEETENEIKRKILSNEKITKDLYAKMQITENLVEKPKYFVEKIRKDEEMKKREKIKNPY